MLLRDSALGRCSLMQLRDSALQRCSLMQLLLSAGCSVSAECLRILRIIRFYIYNCEEKKRNTQV